MKIEIDGITYVPEPAAEPKWGNGAIADCFLDRVYPELMRSADTWTCGTLDIIHREAAYKTAAAALKWYSDECARLREFEPKPVRPVYRSNWQFDR